MKILIGSTGLVGTTLKETIDFDYEFNSKNIDEFLNNDILMLNFISRVYPQQNGW